MTRDEFMDRVIALQETLYRVSYSLLPNPYDQDDAVQETARIALQKWQTLRNENALRPWLIRILINQCYNILRKKKRETPTDEIHAVVPPEGNSEVIDALMRLEPQHRLPVVLNYMEGYTTREIAEIMRLPEGTVKSRIRRAKTLLKDIILDEGGLGHE